MQIKVKKLNENAVMPSYATEFSAGADLYALTDVDIKIEVGETKLIHTGISMAIPENCVGLIYARSGLATKRGLAPKNKVGVIDSDYRGEIMVALFNQSNEVQVINNGERIAQIVITPYIKGEFSESDELEETARGAGGFGSTGTK
jgi:dUTP pyrophosphatase